MNPETFQVYQTEQEQQLALMRGENLQPVEQVKRQPKVIYHDGLNRHERRKAQKLARQRGKHDRSNA